jgi:hypothetical protein
MVAHSSHFQIISRKLCPPGKMPKTSKEAANFAQLMIATSLFALAREIAGTKTNLCANMI